MSSKRPEIVLYCDDGHDEVFVQRFRWLAEQGIWIGTRRATAEVPCYPDASGARHSPVFRGFDGPVADHSQWPLRCKCGLNSPASGNRMHLALTWLASEQQRRISLKELPVLLKKWPRSIVSSGQYPH